MSLKGKTVAITRDALTAREFVSLMAPEGVRVIPVRTMSVRPAGKAAGDAFLKLLREKDHDYCAFLSPQSVRVLFEIANRESLVSELKSRRVVAVGPKTREALMEFGIDKAEMPANFSTAGLIDLFSSKNPAGKRIIVPRSMQADRQLADALTELGMLVDEIKTYSVEATEPSQELIEFATELSSRKIDAVVFTSASNVRNFFDILDFVVSSSSRHGLGVDEIKRNIKAISIGPQTSTELQRKGVSFVESSEHTIKGVAELAKKVLA